MIATKIFMRTFFAENFVRKIFCHLTFFSKIRISRANWQNRLRVHVFGFTSKKKTRLGTAFFSLIVKNWLPSPTECTSNAQIGKVTHQVPKLTSNVQVRGHFFQNQWRSMSRVHQSCTYYQWKNFFRTKCNIQPCPDYKDYATVPRSKRQLIESSRLSIQNF